MPYERNDPSNYKLDKIITVRIIGCLESGFMIQDDQYMEYGGFSYVIPTGWVYTTPDEAIHFLLWWIKLHPTWKAPKASNKWYEDTFGDEEEDQYEHFSADINDLVHILDRDASFELTDDIDQDNDTAPEGKRVIYRRPRIKKNYDDESNSDDSDKDDVIVGYDLLGEIGEYRFFIELSNYIVTQYIIKQREGEYKLIEDLYAEIEILRERNLKLQNKLDFRPGGKGYKETRKNFRMFQSSLSKVKAKTSSKSKSRPRKGKTKQTE